MPSPIAVNVKTQPSQLWSGKQRTGINTLLLLNTDINNTVMVGDGLNSLVVPIAPNGSLSVDPASNWYVVGLVAGQAPLVVVPNGQSNFLGLTQGLGNLAIPSIQSPNFIAGLLGWMIAKNGDAEFNNVVIRGTFMGNNFIINNQGIFIYSGIPALGNLTFSIAANSGVDEFGNAFVVGIVEYGPNGSRIQLATNGTFPAIQLQPASVIHNTANPQMFAFADNAGLVNEFNVLVVTSGKSSNQDDAALQLFGEAADGSFQAQANIEFGGTIFCTISKNGMVLPGNPTPVAVPGSMLLFSDPTGSMRVLDGTDNQIYATERKSLGVATTFTVSSTTPSSVWSIPVGALASGINNYRYEALLLLTPNQSAGAIGIGVNCTAAGSVGNHAFWTTNSPAATPGTTILSRDGLGFSATPVNIGLTMSTTGAPIYAVHISGFMTVAANTTGNFQILANIGTAGDTYNVHPGSYVDLMPS